jgi:hypothetical protein
MRHQARQGGGWVGDEGTHSEHHVRNPHHCGHGLSPEGPGPKAFESNVRETGFPKRFQVPNNVIKHDGKTNPNVWLEDYQLACRACGADDDLFIIQFISIYGLGLV